MVGRCVVTLVEPRGRSRIMCDIPVTALETPIKDHPIERKASWLRATLAHSRRDAMASSTMSGITDNYLGAFAIHLRASASQIGWLTAAPQLAGAMFQLLSVWLCNYLSRRQAIVTGAALQALAVFGMALVGLLQPESGIRCLIVLAIVYHATGNFIQPQWRSWMGSLVPARRRGAFFAGRTRLTMVSSFIVIVLGGLLLGWFDRWEIAGYGFTLLLLLAAAGRCYSAWQLAQMTDPDHQEAHSRRSAQSVHPLQTYRAIALAFGERPFREYSLFFAFMQLAVALSGPFFAVYMLRNLDYSYWWFTANISTAIVTQFFTLKTWGLICDRYGSRIVMVISGYLIPVVPALWLLSQDPYYLLLVQVISGLAWGGFTLSTANYLYDIRPPRADFAIYAAVQSALSAAGVFCGALLGGYLASNLPAMVTVLPEGWIPEHPIVFLFGLSAALRGMIVAWFIPRSVELRIRHKPSLLHVVYRISRFTPGAGVVLDWLTVTRKDKGST